MNLGQNLGQGLDPGGGEAMPRLYTLLRTSRVPLPQTVMIKSVDRRGVSRDFSNVSGASPVFSAMPRSRSLVMVDPALSDQTKGHGTRRKRLQQRQA